jgi:arylformamidase
MSLQRIIDLSHGLNPQTPVYPDYPGVEITILETVHDAKSDRRALNSSRIAVGMHCGTHMDAPFHFYEAGRTIDSVPLDRLIGPAVLADLRRMCRHGLIEQRHLKPYRPRLRKARRIVINTGWAKQWEKPTYFSDHPVMTAEAADFLVECGVLLVGIDAPSVDRPPFPAHLPLLGHDVIIVENLTNLGAIRKPVFKLVVLPLKITAREGSPVRAVAVI